MTNRIDTCLEELRSSGRKALIPYVVAGDPCMATTLSIMHAMVSEGADIIELGVPFSDPMAEGPVIQQGHERALAAGASLKAVLQLVADFRNDNQRTPVVLMGYANPVERMGYSAFAEQAANVGVDGLLTVDLPPEECGALNSELKSRNLKTIFLIAPTTSDARMKQIVEQASGYIYYVSLKGVTGAASLDVSGVNDRLHQIRNICKLPLCVGFGIKDGVTARSVSSGADGVVVGSVLVDAVAKNQSAPIEAIGAIIKDIRNAIDL